MENSEIFAILSKKKASSKKIASILRDYIYTPEFFRDIWMVELWKYYKIDHKTIKKYLKKYVRKEKVNWCSNTKRLKLSKTIYYFIRDLEIVCKKYNWLLKIDHIEIWKIYLDNLKR